jgi:protein arginine kinase
MANSLDELLKQPSEWLRGSGPLSEIVVSSRIRLARNLEPYPFTTRATKTSQGEVLHAVTEGIQGSRLLPQSLVVEMGELTEVDRQFLVERHLVSREHVVQPDHKAVIIGEREAISIMVNEEDHLRIQAMQSGLNLQDAWALITSLDDGLSDVLPYAYSTDWGYLTCCPTNTGTGMRASVMLHLPSLVMTKQINKVLHTITKLGLTARGLFGEGTEASGNFFQISNQVSLGRAEEDIIENLDRILKEVIHQEQAARSALMTNSRVQLEDRIWRAFGILRHAKTISSTEALDLFSAVRLGVDLNLMNSGVDRAVVNELFLFSQPAHLQKLEGKTLSAKERDAKRADLIRKRLGGQA